MSRVSSGWSALLAGKNGIRSLTLAGGVAFHATSVYLVTTVMPTVVQDIGGLDLYAWSTTVFIVASIIGSALSSTLLYGVGPRRAYGLAALVFALGTLGCAFALNMPLLLVGRFVQGLGGGILVALAYSMIRIVFPETLWPRAIALVSAMWGVATLVGPALGGIFAEMGQWRPAFYSLFPVVLGFAVMAYGVLPETSGERPEKIIIPKTQIGLLSLSVLSVCFGSVSSELGVNLLGVLGSLLGFGLLMAIEAKSRQRVETRLFALGTFSLSSPVGRTFLAIVLLTITVTATEIFVPLFLQVLHHQPPLLAGYLAAIMGGGWTLGSVGASGVHDRGARRLMQFSPLLAFLGMGGLILVIPSETHGDLGHLLPASLALLAVGLGVGLGWPHLLTRVIQAAPKAEQSLASASITTLQLYATALGAALSGMVANVAGLVTPGGIKGTASAAFWLFVIFALAPLIAALSIQGTKGQGPS